MSSSDGQNTSSAAPASTMVNGTNPGDAQVAPPTTVRDFADPSSTPRTLMSIEMAAQIRDSVAASYFTSAPSSSTPRPASSGRTFPHGSRYRWGVNWEELFSSSEGQKEDWDSSSKEGSESEEIEYYDLSPRRPPLVNGHGSTATGRDDWVGDGWENASRAVVQPAASGDGHAFEEDDADCEDEDGEEDAQSQDGDEQERPERRQEDRQSSPETPQQTPRPQPRGEWYDATRDGTIWNAGLNGTD
ncbi:hypothetical protein MBLNU457_4851t1 [Dothideomycetes sp. NU457]